MRQTDQIQIDNIHYLRERGASLPEIHKKLKLGYGTIYRYTKNIEILPQYKYLWFGKRGGSKKRKSKALEMADLKAKKVILSLNKEEKMLFLTALYWAEGSKLDFGLSNTDPNLIQLFILGLREVFNVTEDNLKISIRIYEDLDREKCLDYWSKITGVPKSRFISVNVLRGSKKGKLKYGMCRIRVRRGGDLLKYIQAINKEVYRLMISPRSSIG